MAALLVVVLSAVQHPPPTAALTAISWTAGTILGQQRGPDCGPALASPGAQPLGVLGVAGSLHLDLGGSALDLGEVVGGQLDGGCSEVLVQALHSAGARGRHAPGGAGGATRARAMG